MRVICPTCESTYEVPASVVQAGRALRCARCGAQFPASAGRLAEPAPPPLQPAPPPQPPPPVSPGLETVEVRAEEGARLVPAPQAPTPRRPQARPSAAVVAGWALSVVLLAAGAGAALAWREQIMTAWPASTRAYAALGYRR